MNCIDLFLSTFKLCPAPSSLFQPTPFLLFQKRQWYRNWVISWKFYNNHGDLLYNFRSYLCIMFKKKKNAPIWQIYRSIGIYNVHMYHEYDIVWFNTVVYVPEFSQILYVTIWYCHLFWYQVSRPGGFPRRNCYRNGAAVLSLSNLDCLKPLT